MVKEDKDDAVPSTEPNVDATNGNVDHDAEKAANGDKESMAETPQATAAPTAESTSEVDHESPTKPAGAKSEAENDGQKAQENASPTVPSSDMETNEGEKHKDVTGKTCTEKMETTTQKADSLDKKQAHETPKKEVSMEDDDKAKNTDQTDESIKEKTMEAEKPSTAAKDEETNESAKEKGNEKTPQETDASNVPKSEVEKDSQNALSDDSKVSPSNDIVPKQEEKDAMKVEPSNEESATNTKKEDNAENDHEKDQAVREEPMEVEQEAVEPDPSNNNDPEAPTDPNVGRTVERNKVLPSGHFYPLQGKIVSYQEAAERLPPRWQVHWETAEDVILAEEWVAGDLEPDAPILDNSKYMIDQIQERHEVHVEHQLETNNMLTNLLLHAALEEALQTNLHNQQQQDTPQVKGQPAHPPLYYSSNPSSYLQAPTATDTTPGQSSKDQVQTTPAVLAQRVRSGCQWAWNYLVAQQPPAPAPLVASNQRRSSRQPKPVITSTPSVPYPTPVQRGGRICMWWLDALKKEAKRLEEDKKPKMIKQEETKGDSKEEKATKNRPKPLASTETPTKGGDAVMEDDDVVDDSDSDAKGENDEDYSAKEEEGEEDDGDEELEGVTRERNGVLSPVPPSSDEEGEEEEDDEEEDEEEEEDEHDIVYENPYLAPSFPAFLEHLARPKALSGEDVQTALCQATLRIKFNKRSADFGLHTEELSSVDQVVLEQEAPSYPQGKVVLKCVSGETYGELTKMEAQAFSRCKFSLDVIGDQETTQQVQRKQELLEQEAEFKERKAWDKWRHRGIHEGYSTWPDWHHAIGEWVEANVAAATPETNGETDKGDEEVKDDEALAKSLEDSEHAGGGRRRTARRAATSGSEGVFYGNQSQLTQKQLMDAMIRLVKAKRFTTLIGLQAVVADDSNDPIRRTRIGLGKLVWKRNQLARKPVNTFLSDAKILKLVKEKPLVSISSSDPQAGGHDVAPTRELSPEEKGLIEYIRRTHTTELQLRQLVIKHLAEIPIPIIATSADERQGSQEAMDEIDFEDEKSIKWHKKGHDLVGKIIYRPESIKSTTDMSECFWFKIQDYSKPIESQAEDKEEPNCMERRTRFRAVPSPAPGETYWYNTETLLLTEAQVHAGLKAFEMHQEQASSHSGGNPFAGVGDKVTLVPLDMNEGDDAQPDAAEIQATIVGFDNVVDEDEEDGSVEYRILVLPDKGNIDREAFWATLDVRADDSSYMCQPVGESTTWYSIEQFDYHPGSEAYRQCENVVEWLRRQSKSGPFMEPVDPVLLKIPHYTEIVKHPMDISTIAEKLENGQYSTIPPGQSIGISPAAKMMNGTFRKDIELMFDNAMLFNPPDDWIYKAAEQLKKSAIKKIADLSHSADQKSSGAGRARQKKSVYMDEDSDVDLYEYESDHDDDFDGGGRRSSRKRKRGGRGGTKQDDCSSRATEHAVRLQATLRDASDLRGPFANLPINLDASSFSLSCEDWGCRPQAKIPVTATKEAAPEPSAEKRAKEMAELIALQKSVEENEAAGLRRSTRAHHGPSNTPSSKARNNRKGIEYFQKDSVIMDTSSILTWPASRMDAEILLEKRHEDHFSKLYQTYSNVMGHASSVVPFGTYSNGSFPPYLGRVVPSSSNYGDATWEIRSPFVIPALRWVLRGLIQSGHLTALDPMTTDTSSGTIMTNDVYYFDPSLQPYEVLDSKELQRKKRANKSDAEDSEDDVELSEYEQARAARVARNAERLKALGLA